MLFSTLDVKYNLKCINENRMKRQKKTDWDVMKNKVVVTTVFYGGEYNYVVFMGP